MTTVTGARRPLGRAPRSAIGSVWLPRLFVGAAAMSVFIVFVLWLHGGEAAAATRGGIQAATSIGRLAGLVAADLLLIQVLLMARIPWVERVFGQDTLARWHRYVGFASFDLIVVHIILVTIGYAATDRHGVVYESWYLTTTYPAMLLAVAGFAALVAVVVTSLRAARRKLRYESWHLLHLYAYAGVGLALPHQLWTGADFVLTPVARLYWWTAWILTAASILTFRIGLPVWRSVRHDLRVAAVVPEADGVHSIYLRGHDLHRLQVQAGHFFNWRFLHGTGWMRAHPFSLSAAPRPDLLRITVKDLGDGSGALPASLRAGTRVLIEGPYGRLTGAVRRRRRITFIACGIGITPLRALLESEYYRRGEAVLLYRAANTEEFTFAEEIEHLAHNRGVTVIYLPGPRGPDNSWLPAGYGNPEALLRQNVPGIADSDVYICGPEPWMDGVRESLYRLAVPSEHVHLERFAW